MKTVPAITIRSASRGVPRITSAPNREISYLLVMLVAISTKQHERPKLKGHTEFLRLHATRSSTRDRTRLRCTASSRLSSVFSACGEASGRVIDQCMAHHPGLTHHSSAPMSPIKSADAPQISQRRKQYGDEQQHLGVAGPSNLTDRDRPGKQKHSFQIEDDEEHGHQIKLGRKPYACRTFREDARFAWRASSPVLVPLTEDKREAQHGDNQQANDGDIDCQRPKLHSSQPRCSPLALHSGGCYTTIY